MKHRSRSWTISIVIVTLMLLMSLLSPIGLGVASAQVGREAPGQDEKRRTVPLPIPDDRTEPRQPGEAPDVGVWIEEGDRRSIRSDVAEEFKPAEPAADGFGEIDPSEPAEPNPTTPTQPVKPVEGDTPVGFVPGQSIYRETTDGGRTHVWDNPDGTTTVGYWEHPTEVDEQTGKATDDTPGLKRSDSNSFEHTENGVKVTAAQTSARVEDFNPALNEVPDRPAGNPPLIQLETESGDMLRFDVVGQANVNGTLGADNAVIYPELIKGVNLEVEATASGFKANYVADNAEAIEGLFETYEMPEGWTWEQGPGVILFSDTEGELVFSWGGGVAYDSEGPGAAEVGSVGVHVIAQDGQQIMAKVIVDTDWLESKDRVFPVTVDPYHVYLGVNQDTWVGEGVTTSQAGSDILQLDGRSGSIKHSLIEFNQFWTSDQFIGMPVVSAELLLANSYQGDCGTRNLAVRRITQSWSQYSALYTNEPSSVHDGDPTGSWTNCSNNNYWGFTVTKTVQHFAQNPGSEYGFFLHLDAGAPYRSFFSSNYANSSYRPSLRITYDSPTVYGAEYYMPAEAEGQAVEAILPQPGTTSDPNKYGHVPARVSNTGSQNWPSGKHASNLNPNPAHKVCLAYHAVEEGTDPAAGWDLFEGVRTCPEANASNMYDHWVAVANNQPPPNVSPFVYLYGNVRNSDRSTPGTYDVYFTMVHEGNAWFESTGVALAEPVTIRWTEPPAVTTPVSGQVISVLDDLVFDWDHPYQGTADQWDPTSYRVRVYAPGGTSPIYEETVPGSTTTLTVTPEDLGDDVGSLIWQVQARDGDNERPDQLQLWTTASSGGLLRQAVALGSPPYGENFAGVDPSIGNLHVAFSDLSFPTAGGSIDLTRHVNSMNTNKGLFGPGITTEWELSFHCASSCLDHEGDRILARPDGSKTHFAYDDASDTLNATDGSEVTAELVGGKWKVEFKDGAYYEFEEVGSTWGDLSKIVDRAGHVTNIATNPSTGYPETITDAESGRALHLVYQAYPPHFPTSRVVTKAYIGTPGTSAYQEMNYTYTISSVGSGPSLVETWWLDTACDGESFCETYDWTPDGRIDLITYPSNGRKVDPSFDTDGRVSQIVDGTGAQTGFTYSTGSTTVNDGRGNDWIVDYDAQKRTTKLTDPAGGFSTYAYVDGRRTHVTDAAGHTLNLTYDDDGNLLSETNAEGDTTYYRYELSHFGDPTHIVGPSHICDARSADAADGTYCLQKWYDTDGNLTAEREPDETSSTEQTWSYTTGSETATGGGTVPRGLLKSYNDGNISADGGPGVTTYGYNAAGNLTNVTYPSGLTATSTYDDLGRILTQSQTADGQTTTLRTITERYANGTIKIETSPPATNPISGVTHQLRTAYVWDGNGNLDLKTQSDVSGGDTDQYWVTAQDEMDRTNESWDPESLTMQGGQVVAYAGTIPASSTHDANGNILTVTDQADNTAQTTYNSRNLPITLIAVGFNDGHSSTANRTLSETSWTANGQVETLKTWVSATDWTLSTNTYDDADRLTATTVSDSDGNSQDVVSNSYAPQGGFLVSRVSGDTSSALPGDRQTTTYTYRNDGGIASGATEGRTTTFGYDDAGNMTQTTTTGTDGLDGTATVQTTTNTYDKTGNLREVLLENGSQDIKTTTTFNQRGLAVSTVSPRGYEAGNTPGDFRTTLVYDVLGRLTRSESPPADFEHGTGIVDIEANWQTGNATLISEVGYDTFGNRTHAKDSDGNVTVTTFDKNNRRTGISHPTYTPPGGTPTTATESWGYDPNGNTTSHTSRKGHVTTFEFDSANRPVRQTDPAIPNPDGAGLQTPGISETFYDWAGQVVRSVSAEGAEASNSYDMLGQVTSSSMVVRAVGDQPALTSTNTFTYTGQGFAKTIADPAGVVTTTTFNTFGQALTSQTGTLSPTSVVYDGLGRIRKATNGTGAYTVTTYDQAGRAVQNDLYGNNSLLAETTSAVYDAAGNVTSSTDGRGATTNYSYDNLGQLESVAIPTDGTPGNEINYSYGYDRLGHTTRVTDGNTNITRYTFNVWGLNEATLEPAASGDTEADRLWWTEFDAGGQPLVEHHPGNKTVTRAYNALGLPTSEISAQAGLNTVGKTWGYDRVGRPVRLSHPDTPQILTYDDRSLLISTTGGGGTTSSIFDETGRPVFETTEAGTIGYIYDSNGQLERTSGDPAAGVAPAVVQPGMVVAYTNSDTPTGWVEADGSTLSQAAYGPLYLAIGDTYGGDATTFDVPDYRGRALTGADPSDPMFDVVGESGGSLVHTLTVAEMPSHTHIQGSHTHTQNAHNHTQAAHNHSGVTSTAGAHTHQMGWDGSPAGSGNAFRLNGFANKAHDGHGFIGSAGAHSHTVTINNKTATNNPTTATNSAATATNSYTGAGVAHSVLQPYVAVRWLIATEGDAVMVPGMMVAFAGQNLPSGWQDAATGGRTPVGMDSTVTQFDVLGETGGTASRVLTEAEMPSHTHIQNSHNHTQNAHNHTQNPHNHSASTSSAGAHSHRAGWSWGASGSNNSLQLYAYGRVPTGAGFTAAAGNHYHTVSTGSKTATNNAATATNNPATPLNATAGGGSGHSVVQPYAVMRWITPTISDPGVTAGMVFADASNGEATDGWLDADGDVLGAVEYPELDGQLGDLWGGSSSSTVILPDMAGRLVVDQDTSDPLFDTVGETGGSVSHVLTEAELPVHTHTQSSHNHTQSSHNHTQNAHTHSGSTNWAGNHTHLSGWDGSPAGSGNALRLYAFGRQPTGHGFLSTDGNHTHTVYVSGKTATNNAATGTNQATTGVNQDTGGDQAYDITQPYMVVQWRVAAKSQNAGATAAWTVDYGHNAAGQMTGVDYNGGGTRTLTYTPIGHLATDTLTNTGGATTASLAYTYDCVGQLTRKQVVLPGNTDAGVNTYTYDHAGRLTSWDTDPGSQTATGCTPGQTTANPTPTGLVYTYDDAGNRLSAGVDSFTYDARNRIVSDPDGTYSWHPDGTLETYDLTVGADEDYTFDAGGRIAEVSDGTDTTSYVYDHLDRITERNNIPFLYRGVTLDPVDDGTNTYTRSTAGGLVTHNDSTGAITFPLTDVHGDMVGLIQSDGTLSDSQVFDPYGEALDTTGSTDVLLGFQSDWTDPVTEHVWMGARWYQPSTGTFLSRDTVFGELATPFSLNRYTYGVNNPVRFFDPDGRATVAGWGTPTEQVAKIHKWDDNVPSAVKYSEGGSTTFNAHTDDFGTGTWSVPPPKSSYVPISAVEATIVAINAQRFETGVIIGNDLVNNLGLSLPNNWYQSTLEKRLEFWQATYMVNLGDISDYGAWTSLSSEAQADMWNSNSSEVMDAMQRGHMCKGAAAHFCRHQQTWVTVFVIVGAVAIGVATGGAAYSVMGGMIGTATASGGFTLTATSSISVGIVSGGAGGASGSLYQQVVTTGKVDNSQLLRDATIGAAAGGVLAGAGQGIRAIRAAGSAADDVGGAATRVSPKPATNTTSINRNVGIGDPGPGAMGATDKFGNITIRPGLSPDDFVETLRHETVHSVLSPKPGSFAANFRADIRMLGYEHSNILQYTEEALAEGYATRSLTQGLSFPFGAGYVAPGALALETAGVGAGGYLGYEALFGG